jgi:hypothetical protein
MSADFVLGVQTGVVASCFIAAVSLFIWGEW